MDYTVVIVTYNRLEKLKKCLQCVYSQTVAAGSIIVVNNHCTDGTTEFLENEKYNHRNLIVLELNENLGGSGGFYRGIERAVTTNNEWVLLIDDDAMLRQNYMEEIFKRIKPTSAYLAYAGSVRVSDINSLYHRKRIIKGIRYKELSVPNNEYMDDFECDLASFCGLVISMELINKIGLPEGSFFIWYDDTEFCHRIKNYSKILNVSSAVLDHEVVEGTYYNKKESPKMVWKDYYGLRNRIYTIKKHCGRIALFYEIIFYSLRIVKFSLLAKVKNNQDYAYNAKTISTALHDGICNRLGKNIEYLPL